MTPVIDLEFEPPLPPSLRKGARVRVRLAGDGTMVEGVLRRVDRRALVIEVPPAAFAGNVLDAFTVGGPWIQDETRGESREPLMRGVAWKTVDRIWVRTRAAYSGFLWGVVLVLALGWCGDGMDHLTDGFPTHETMYMGQAIGVLVGLAVAFFGREWHRLETPFAAGSSS